MDFHKVKNTNIACFTKEEMIKLFKVDKKAKLSQEIKNRDISVNDLKNNYQQMDSLASIMSQKISNDRDDHEIFASLFVYLDFYERKSEICFELQTSFNPKKDKIITLEDLNKFRAGATLSDFIIKSKDSFRQFQLKRYRNSLNTREVFNFIKEKVGHYGNDLGDTNLLMALQSTTDDVSNVNFRELHDKLKLLNLKFKGQILISYNENNKEMVINQVHPKLTTTRIPIQSPSAQLGN